MSLNNCYYFSYLLSIEFLSYYLVYTVLFYFKIVTFTFVLFIIQYYMKLYNNFTVSGEHKIFIGLSQRHTTILRKLLLYCKYINITYSFTIKFLKCKKLTIGLLNPGSLGTRHTEFLVAMDRHNVDIMAINETWLRDGEEARAPAPADYRLRHVPRPADLRARGGGVGFYIKRGITARILAHPHAPSVEQMWLSVTANGVRLAIGTAYRPPWLNVDVFLDALSESISSFGCCEHVVLVGDFNINILNTCDSQTTKFCDFMSSMNITQYVDSATHFTEHSETLIDVVCSDMRISNVCVDHIPDLSSHAFITCTLNIMKMKPPPKFIVHRPLKDIDINDFNNDLNAISWERFIHEDVDIMLKTFSDAVLYLYDKHAPLKIVYIKDQSHPWITYTIKEMIKLRDKAHEKFKLFKSVSHKNYYKQLKVIVNIAIRNEKTAYFNQHINRHLRSPKLLWKNIKKTVVDFNKKNIELPFDLCNPNKISEHFLNIPGGAEVDTSFLTFFNTNRFSPSIFTLKTVSEETVSKIIKCIKTNAQGADGITLEMIVLTIPRTLSIITSIVNQSIKTGVFPSHWKNAIIKPIPKKQHASNLRDLRPISILPLLSKVLEKVVCIQLTDYLESNQILPSKQSGFRKSRSTATALLDVVDNILAAQDVGQGSILVLLDFSRAFDTINTSLLLSKLSYYGCDSIALKWFTSYLFERTQYVETRSDDGSLLVSAASPVSRGVPQGSILGPLLFILYSTDVVKKIKHCNYHLYADDLQLYISFKPDDTKIAVTKLNSDLEDISHWCEKNNLLLNPDKSKFVILGSKFLIKGIAERKPRVSVNGCLLEYVTQARNLGLLMDGGMRFENHVLDIMRNCFYRLKILYRIRECLNVDMRIKICETLVLSKLNYIDAVFGGCLLARTKKLLQRVQNACVRYCFSVPRYSHITPYLNQSGLLNMASRRALHFATLLFGVVRTGQPDYLYNKLQFSHRPTRLASLLLCPPHRTSAFRGSFRFAAAKCWNDLPPPIRNCNSVSTFKTKLRNIILLTQISST
jgi:hypothetical protein